MASVSSVSSVPSVSRAIQVMTVGLADGTTADHKPSTFKIGDAKKKEIAGIEQGAVCTALVLALCTLSCCCFALLHVCVCVVLYGVLPAVPDCWL